MLELLKWYPVIDGPKEIDFSRVRIIQQEAVDMQPENEQYPFVAMKHTDVAIVFKIEVDNQKHNLTLEEYIVQLDFSTQHNLFAHWAFWGRVKNETYYFIKYNLVEQKGKIIFFTFN
ncbi:MAG: hypothetical protein PHS07_00795 [Patescibacteria group bacterium]|nr:hypothetical protein [Patescibacteria group bacterium]